MRSGGWWVIVAAAAPALGVPRESSQFAGVLSRGALNTGANELRTASFTGQYATAFVALSGVLRPLAPGTWASDARVRISPPSGPPTLVQMSDIEGFSAPLSIGPLTVELSARVAPVSGAWTLRFYETVVDSASGDAVWDTFTITLDDAPLPPRWTEVGDAGDLPATAQTCAGSGTLAQIRGSILGDEADMYLIDVCDPAHFSATTVGGAAWDTQLFLFRQDGSGAAFDDDDPVTQGFQSRLSAQFVHAPGRYLLAISRYDRKPVDQLGRLLWQDEPIAVERAPDGPGAGGAVLGWRTTSFGTAGMYTIALSGTCFVDVAPACPADLDDGSGTGTPDGGVTIDDLLYFLGAFTNGELGADVDDGSGLGHPDGGVTIDDLLFFVVHFEAGC